ncbi:MAG TPA: tetratricopeptide repeat protein [Solirubrobacteraceae bacterium]|nr:tetratricopeptide repeat protein [Solirubrobacteraceae bacterium]
MQDRHDERTQIAGGVAIRLLGGFEAMRAGEAVAESSWRLRKGRELVKLLALAPHHRLHREQVTEFLWPESEPSAAANNLHQVLHAARRALGSETITLRDEVLTLYASVDVDDFERASVHARRERSPSAYRSALTLYGGELLPENRYEDWAGPRREELQELCEQLERERGSLDGAERPSGLPVQSSSFIGREHELAELKATIARARLLTLVGPGGAGKTRLAIELAIASELGYADGTVFVELADVPTGDVVAGAVAAALDVATLPGRALSDGVADFLARRTVLLVLDNCEHVLRGAAALTDTLLRAAPALTILATSREALRVPGEIVFRVPSMALPDPTTQMAAEELLRYESVRLLDDRAKAIVPEFAIDAENSLDLARICFRLDGLPLALELAAARIGSLGTAALAARLDDRFRLLGAGNRAGPTRQQTLAATLEWSHELLDEPEKLLLARLSVFAGGFDLTAAEEVCAHGELGAGDVADLLARLVDKSLVAVEPAGRELRYRLLETVRLYARERLRESSEEALLRQGQASWALALVRSDPDAPRLDRDDANLRAAHDELLSRDSPEALDYCIALTPFWLRRIDLEEAPRRFRAALERRVRRDAQRAEALLAASAVDLRGGELHGGTEHAQESYEIACEIGDASASWHALQRLGDFAVSYDEGARALALFERACEITAEAGLAQFEAVSRYSLGVARWLMGDVAVAEQLLIESAECLRLLAPGQRVPSLLNIAEMRAAEPSLRPGLRIVFEETLHPLVSSTVEAAIGYVTANQATIARLAGEHDRARLLLADAGGRFASMRDDRGQAYVLVRSAYLALAERRPEDARGDLERALELRREMRDRRGIGIALAALGLVETEAGDYESAETRLNEATDLFRRAGDRWGLVSSLWRSSELELARGRLEAARDALEEARRVVGATGREAWIAVTDSTLAEVAALEEDAPRATLLFEQARDRYLAIGDDAGAAAMQTRMQSVAEARQSPRKVTAARNARTATTKRRQS